MAILKCKMCGADLHVTEETKIVECEYCGTTQTVEVRSEINSATTESLLKRAFMFLEDGIFKSTEEYCEKVLDINPECAKAYLGLLMAELKVKKQDDLKNCAEPFDGRNNYQKAVRFADDGLKKTLEGYIAFIIDRNLNATYNKAVNIMTSAKQRKSMRKQKGYSVSWEISRIQKKKRKNAEKKQKKHV